MTFLTLDFPGAPYHLRSTQSLWEYLGEPNIFIMWEPRGSSLGEDRCMPTCPRPFKLVTFESEAVVLESPLCLVSPAFGLYRDLDQLKNEATPQFTPVAMLGVIRSFHLPLAESRNCWF